MKKLSLERYPEGGLPNRLRTEHVISDGPWVAARLYGRSEDEARAVLATLSGEKSGEEIRIDFPGIGHAGPFPVVNGEVTMPAKTMADLAHHFRMGYAKKADDRNAEEFADWLAREMPAGTVIGDPRWWAEYIIRRMCSSPDSLCMDCAYNPGLCDTHDSSPTPNADPCPGCPPGITCRTPKCGRLAGLPNPAEGASNG